MKKATLTSSGAAHPAHHRSRLLRTATSLLATASCLCAQAQYSIDWSTIDGGGGTSTGGVYTVSGTIGQPDAGGIAVPRKDWAPHSKRDSRCQWGCPDISIAQSTSGRHFRQPRCQTISDDSLINATGCYRRRHPASHVGLNDCSY